MKIIYITNGMGLHSKAISDAFYKILGNDFVFLDIRKPNETHSAIHKEAEEGMDYNNIEYIFHAMQNGETQKKAWEIVNDADIAICSGNSWNYIRHRLSQSKITFYISERWLKKPKYLISPLGWYSLLKSVVRYQSPCFYHLALGAYCANDAAFLHIFRNKMFKFAYLVPIEQYDVKKSLINGRKEVVEILWCSRFIDWKHPELVTNLAKRLVNSGYLNFHITMIGSRTPIQDMEKNFIEKNELGQYVTIVSGMPNYKVRSMMKESNIFLLTSDHEEGWGVVLNEAMGAGCAVVASSQSGATPFLIKQGVNGMIFKSGSLDSLDSKVKNLLDDCVLREKIAESAYYSISETWGADVVAGRFIELCKGLIEGNKGLYNEGPCSLALPCDENNVLADLSDQ